MAGEVVVWEALWRMERTMSAIWLGLASIQWFPKVSPYLLARGPKVAHES